MKKLILIIFAIHFLFGCATFQTMEKGLTELGGHHINDAFQVLGYPSAKQEFGDVTVYIWNVQSSGALPMPQTTTTTGYIGSTPVYGQTQSMMWMPVHYQCEIKLGCNSDGYIQTWEYYGNHGGCNQWMQRLTKYYNDQHPKQKEPVKTSDTKPSTGSNIEDWRIIIDYSKNTNPSTEDKRH